VLGELSLLPEAGCSEAGTRNEKLKKYKPPNTILEQWVLQVMLPSACNFIVDVSQNIVL
jgi:hypothetical protein